MSIPILAQQEKERTHCPKGHEYNEENTIIEKYGKKVCRRCRICKNERSKKYEVKHREQGMIRNKKYRKENPEKIKLYDHRSTIRKYGLTEEKYNEILESQNGVCAICGNECSSGNNLSVDHCHETDKVRGLLCGKCNKGLGMFKDSIEILEKAIHYLYRHKISKN